MRRASTVSSEFAKADELKDGEERYAASHSNDKPRADWRQGHRQQQKGHAAEYPRGVPKSDADNKLGLAGRPRAYPDHIGGEPEQADTNATENRCREPAHRVADGARGEAENQARGGREYGVRGECDLEHTVMHGIES